MTDQAVTAFPPVFLEASKYKVGRKGPLGHQAAPHLAELNPVPKAAEQTGPEQFEHWLRAAPGSRSHRSPWGAGVKGEPSCAPSARTVTNCPAKGQGNPQTQLLPLTPPAKGLPLSLSFTWHPRMLQVTSA